MSNLNLQDIDSFLSIAKQQYIFDYAFKQNPKHINCAFDEARWIKDFDAMFDNDSLLVMNKDTVNKVGTMLAPEALDRYFIFN